MEGRATIEQAATHPDTLPHHDEIVVALSAAAEVGGMTDEES